MIHIADRRTFHIGRFRIDAKPLDTNPAWTTHHVYIGDMLIGRQLSVPNLSDCEYLAYLHRHPISALDVVLKHKEYSLRRRGRPRKQQTLEEAIA